VYSNKQAHTMRWRFGLKYFTLSEEFKVVVLPWSGPVVYATKAPEYDFDYSDANRVCRFNAEMGNRTKGRFVEAWDAAPRRFRINPSRWKSTGYRLVAETTCRACLESKRDLFVWVLPKKSRAAAAIERCICESCARKGGMLW